MAKGSNDLNMLLKSQVVKVRAELDLNNSMPKIRVQVDTITKRLLNKPVKLRVELDYKLIDVFKQRTSLQKRLNMQPLKLAVRLDTAGAVGGTGGQFKGINKMISDFNLRYSKELQNIQQQAGKTQKAVMQATNIPASAMAKNFNNIKQYTNALTGAENILRSKFSDGKGIFGTTQLKDEKGNLQTFTAELRRADGIVESIKYKWNAKSGEFTPITRKTVDNVQRNVHQATQSLRSLQSEIDKLRQGSNAQVGFLKEYEKLNKMSKNNTLTKDAVKDLQTRIKQEQTLQGIVDKQNKEYYEQEKLIKRIENARDKAWRTSQKQDKDIAQRQKMTNMVSNVRSDSSPENLRQQSLELDKINNKIAERNRREAVSLQNERRRNALMREMSSITRVTPKSDVTSQNLIREINLLGRGAKTTQDWINVRKKLNALRYSNENNKEIQRTIDLQTRLEAKLREYHRLTRASTRDIERDFKRMYGAMMRGHADMSQMFNRVNNDVRRTRMEMKDLADQTKVLMTPNQHGRQLANIRSAFDHGDTESMKKYIGEIYKGRVETIAFESTTDRAGRAVDRMKVQMAGAGKNARKYTVDLDRLNNELRQSYTALSYNANRNLGVFEQLRIAMARVPVWMGAMTVFYGSIRSVRAMANEILELDKAMVEFARVASNSLNLEYVFQSSISMAKELGNEVHTVLQTMNDFARTYGEFNERQLLAITNTATLMSNVSELSAEEAGQTLVATMNAFNIEAEESIRIVNALNEVDNNYAVSTAQLSEGLSKSASTARSFGVTMEENIGHITAISSVTMESGRIIGNSLKTIYSRLTTMDGAKDALEAVGVAIHTIGETGEEVVRPVTDILGDLSKVWWDLSDAQRQNTAVQVAGRYQLSRFLGMMNNYHIAVSATETAINSEGSAMRENAEYMKSYEARINKLKVAFTEFSQSMGDAILSDSIILVVDGLRKLADGFGDLVDKFGFLPILFAGLTPIMVRFGVFNKLIGTVSGTLRGGAQAFGIFREALGAKLGIAGALEYTNLHLKDASNGMQGLNTATKTATPQLRIFGGVLKGLVASTLIGGAFVALGVAIENLIRKSGEAKRAQEELDDLQGRMIETYRRSSDGMASMIERFDYLRKETNLTVEEQAELNELTQTFAEGIPTTVRYIDANGKAHMKTTEEIKEQVKAVRELSKAEADLKRAQFLDTIEERKKQYTSLNEDIDKTIAKIKELREEDGKKVKIQSDSGGIAFGIKKDTGNYRTINNTEEIAKAQVELMKLESERTGLLQENIMLIQEQSRAYFEVRGEMDKLGEAQRMIMDDAISQNEKFLRDAGENINSAMLKLNDFGIEVGNVFVQAFDILESRADTNDPFKLEKLQSDLAGIIDYIPEDFFNLDKQAGNVEQAKDRIVNDLKEVINVGHQIQQGSGDWDGLVKRLMDVGYSSDEAKRMVHLLGKDFKNSAIQAEALADETYDDVKALQELEQQIEGMDITEALFGYDKGSMSAIESHIQAMMVLEEKYGETDAKQYEVWQNAKDTVIDYLNITEEEFLKNRDTIFKAIQALQEIDFSEIGKLDGDGNVQTYESIIKGLEGIDEATRDWLLTHDFGIDALTGKSREVIDVNEEIVESIENIPEVFDTTQTAYENFQKGLQHPTDDNFINKIGKDADNTKEKMDETSGRVDELRNQLLHPTSNGFMDSVQSQTDETVKGVRKANEEFENLKSNFATNEYKPLPVVEDAKTALKTIGDTIDEQADKLEVFKGTIYEGTDFTVAHDSIRQLLGDTLLHLDEVGAKARELESAFANMANETGNMKIISENIDDIKQKIDETIKILGDLKSGMNDFADESTLAGAYKAIEKIGEKAKESESKFKELIDTISTANIATNIGGYTDSIMSLNVNVISAKHKITELIDESMRIISVIGVINKVRDAFSSIGDGAGKGTGKIINALRGQSTGLTSLRKDYLEAQINIRRIFDRLAENISSKSNSMITSHNRHREAIKTLARTARDARRDLLNLNSTISSSISAVNNYITRASNLRTVSRTATNSASNTTSSFAPRPLSVLTGSSGVFSGAPAMVQTAFTALSSGASSGDGGISGGGNTATSGIVKPSIYAGYSSLNGDFGFQANATKKKSSKKNTVKLDELYKPNNNERQITIRSGVLRELEESMKRINEHTAKYRKALQDVVKHNRVLLNLNKKELSRLQKRNKTIDKRLKQLKNVSKHTEKQRQEYNRLQQEYDQNLSNIANLKGEVQSLTNEIRDKTEAISADLKAVFTNMVETIIGNFNELVTGIENRIDNIDFKLEINELTNGSPEERVKLLADKVRELNFSLMEFESVRKTLEKQLTTAVKRYGHSSDIVMEIRKELQEVEEAFEDSYLNILRTQNDIANIRGGIADNIIDKLKDNYKKEKDLVLKSKDTHITSVREAHKAELESLESTHKKKMKVYDEEIEKINNIYDAKLREIDDDASEEDYQEQLDGMIKERSDLEELVARLSNDDSLSGRKRYAEAEEELKNLNKDIDKFIRDRHRDLLKTQLNDQKEAQIEEIQNNRDTEQEKYETTKETLEKNHEILIDTLEKEMKAVEEHYDSIIEDEKRWAEVRKSLMEGNFSAINDELVNMSINLEQLSDGTFDSLSEGFAEYSQEVRDFVMEISRMISQINDITSINPNTGSINPDGSVNIGRETYARELKPLIDGAFAGRPLLKPTPEKQYLYDTIRQLAPSIGDGNMKTAEYRVNEIYKAAKAGRPLQTPTPDKMVLYNLFQEILRREGSFDTGGYTGEWGSEGRLAILHQKELVLNERQTKDILDTVKIVNKLSGIIPRQKTFNTASEFQNSGGIVSISYGDINVTVENGDKKKAKDIVKEIMTEVRKGRG